MDFHDKQQNNLLKFNLINWITVRALAGSFTLGSVAATRPRPTSTTLSNKFSILNPDFWILLTPPPPPSLPVNPSPYLRGQILTSLGHLTPSPSFCSPSYTIHTPFPDLTLFLQGRGGEGRGQIDPPPSCMFLLPDSKSDGLRLLKFSDFSNITIPFPSGLKPGYLYI